MSSPIFEHTEWLTNLTTLYKEVTDECVSFYHSPSPEPDHESPDFGNRNPSCVSAHSLMLIAGRYGVNCWRSVVAQSEMAMMALSSGTGGRISFSTHCVKFIKKVLIKMMSITLRAPLKILFQFGSNMALYSKPNATIYGNDMGARACY